MKNYFYLSLQLIARLFLRANWNGSIPDTVDDFVNLIKASKHNVWIVTGDLEYTVFDNDRVLNEMKSVITRAKNPVNIEILCGPRPDARAKKILKLAKEKEDRLNIIKLTERPKAHFLLVDGGKRIRIEEFHEANEPERVAYSKSNALFLGSVLQDEFRRLRKSGLNNPVTVRR